MGYLRAKSESLLTSNSNDCKTKLLFGHNKVMPKQCDSFTVEVNTSFTVEVQISR